MIKLSASPFDASISAQRPRRARAPPRKCGCYSATGLSFCDIASDRRRLAAFPCGLKRGMLKPIGHLERCRLSQRTGLCYAPPLNVCLYLAGSFVSQRQNYGDSNLDIMHHTSVSSVARCRLTAFYTQYFPMSRSRRSSPYTSPSRTEASFKVRGKNAREGAVRAASATSTSSSPGSAVVQCPRSSRTGTGTVAASSCHSSRGVVSVGYL